MKSRSRTPRFPASFFAAVVVGGLVVGSGTVDEACPHHCGVLVRVPLQVDQAHRVVPPPGMYFRFLWNRPWPSNSWVWYMFCSIHSFSLSTEQASASLGSLRITLLCYPEVTCSGECFIYRICAFPGRHSPTGKATTPMCAVLFVRPPKMPIYPSYGPIRRAGGP